MGVTRNFVLFAGELHPPSITQDRFYTVLITWDKLGCPLSGIGRCPLFRCFYYTVYINHSEFSWYIKQCPLLSRGPLLGASVNGELTVLGMASVVCVLVLCVSIVSHSIQARSRQTNYTI